MLTSIYRRHRLLIAILAASLSGMGLLGACGNSLTAGNAGTGNSAGGSGGATTSSSTATTGTAPASDDDGDGFSEDQGDCNGVWTPS